MFRRWLIVLACSGLLVGGEGPPAITVGLIAEMSRPTSTSGQAIERGLRLALARINAGGGVLGGRPLQLEVRDSRSIAARGVAELRDLAARPDVVAVVGGKFSPVVLESLAATHELGIPYLLPWSAADGVIDHAYRPSFTFRLSLRDSGAMPALMRRAAERGQRRVGLMLLANAWGRSNLAAAEAAAREAGVTIVGAEYIPVGASDLLPAWGRLVAAGADSVVTALNEGEAAPLVRQLATIPAADRRPLLCHWGVTGGDFAALCGTALGTVDLAVVQTFLFAEARGALAGLVAADLAAAGVADPARLPSGVGLAHAWDLAHLLAQAITAAGSTDRARVRDALENLGPWEGLVRTYERPFAPDRHEALSPEQVVIARFTADGRLVPDR
jgi:branched-chain amino acid transport system substrate-binding protein